MITDEMRTMEYWEQVLSHTHSTRMPACQATRAIISALGREFHPSDARLNRLCAERDAGDENALQVIVDKHMDLAVAGAYTMLVRVRQREEAGISAQRLLKAAMSGLEQAAKRFDPARGFAFTTYAKHWISHSVNREWQRGYPADERLTARYSQTQERARAGHELGRTIASRHHHILPLQRARPRAWAGSCPNARTASEGDTT